MYAKERKRIIEHRQKGENPDDWKIIMHDVEESFKETMQLLHKLAEEQGINLET